MSFKRKSRPQLEKHIRNAARNTEMVFITSHAQKRMRERRVLDAEVYHCLQTGKLILEPEEDLKTGNLVCRMECYGASKHLAVCAALDDNDPMVIVVTVIVKD